MLVVATCNQVMNNYCIAVVFDLW